jgi:class 3 adenylate cyclase
VFGSDQYLRINEVLSSKTEQINIKDTNGDTQVVDGNMKISIREFIRWQAILDLLRTLFVVILFYIAIFFFMSDATRLIIEPLERLLQQVKEMSQNPSKALKLAEKRKKNSRKKKEKNQSDLDSIRETISKLAYLLVLGFGRAGDSVISKILYSKNMNLQIKASGTHIYGIFGFCDIRNFTDVTEVLGTEVIRFVNTCGDIVHKIIDKYKGGANKNIGDAFLLVWKLESTLSDVQEFTEYILTQEERKEIWEQYEPLKNYEKEQELIKKNKQKYNVQNPEYEAESTQKVHISNDIQDNDLQVDSQMRKLVRKATCKETIKKWDLKKVEEMTTRFRNNLKNSTLAELSFISFLKCIEGVTTDPRTLKYSKHQDIRKKLGDYLVSLGFGLHAGWAVEGALGSKYKIDLSYLSPNVDMSNRLEGLTKKYKKPLLFTNSIYNLMTSQSIMNLCRKIDRVTVNGTTIMEYFAVDFSVPYLQYMDKISKLNAKGKMDEKKVEILGIRKVGNKYRTLSIQQNRRKTTFIQGEVNQEIYKNFDKIERTFEEILMDQNLCFLLCIDSPENKKERTQFMNSFSDAFKHYELGEWEEAIPKLEKVIEDYRLDGKPDGTSEFLLKYIKENIRSAEYQEFVNRDFSRISPDE